MRELRYSHDERVLAKTLVVAYGTPERARDHLLHLWGPGAEEREASDSAYMAPATIPSVDSLRNWERDDRVPLDLELLDRLEQELKHRARHSAARIAAAAETRLMSALEPTSPVSAKDAKDYASIWDMATSKNLGTGKFSAPGLSVDTGGAPMFVTYGLADVPQRRSVDVSVSKRPAAEKAPLAEVVYEG